MSVSPHLHPTALTPQEADSVLRLVFPGLSATAAITLWPYLKTYCAQEDTPVFQLGEAGDYMLFTIEGLVKVVGTDPAEPEVLALLRRGEMLGEMALIDHEPRSATCIALEQTTFAVLTRADFERLSAQQPHLALAIMAHIARTLSVRLRRASKSSQEPADLFERYS